MQIPLLEMFSSAQGEGPFVGCRQLFIRLSGCNLLCDYCDTLTTVDENCCKIETMAGSNQFSSFPWPLELDQVIDIINNKYDLKIHHSISITGGEPLLHYKLLQNMLPLLKGTKNGIFLETNGTLPEALQQVIEYINIISMDIKLPSVANINPCWDQHRKFIQIARSSEAFLYVKIVVSKSTSKQDLETVWELMRDEAPDTMLVIQPVTPFNGIKAPDTKQLLQWQLDAMTYLDNVRIIPQTHRMIGLL